MVDKVLNTHLYHSIILHVRNPYRGFELLFETSCPQFMLKTKICGICIVRLGTLTLFFINVADVKDCGFVNLACFENTFIFK